MSLRVLLFGLGFLILLLLPLLLLGGCAYEDTVASRSVALRGSASATGEVGGKVVYKVEYR